MPIFKALVLTLATLLFGLQAAAAAGLFVLMLCGLWARWRIRDPWPE